MQKHVIFDLDGTLIDSKQEILETYMNVFYQFPPEPHINYEKNISYTATLETNMKLIYENDSVSVSKAKKLFAEIYDQSFFEKTILYPSVYDVLNYLYKHKYTLHIATNKRLKPSLRILEFKKINGFINSVKACDQMTGKIISKKEMVTEICKENNLKTGIMIGDSGDDIEAGQENGLTTVAVTYGYQKKENLVKKKPTFVIDSITELKDILEMYN